MCMYVCVCTYAYINMQIHTNSYRIRIRSRIRIRIRDRIRNSLKSRIRIRDRIRNKSFRIHNTALNSPRRNGLNLYFHHFLSLIFLPLKSHKLIITNFFPSPPPLSLLPPPPTPHFCQIKKPKNWESHLNCWPLNLLRAPPLSRYGYREWEWAGLRTVKKKQTYFLRIEAQQKIYCGFYVIICNFFCMSEIVLRQHIY